MPRLLDGFKINMSHQEMDRLVEELDNLWKAFTMSDDGERRRPRLPHIGRGAVPPSRKLADTQTDSAIQTAIDSTPCRDSFY